MPGTSVSVLFVCLGNICRSPLAEGIFASLAGERGLDGQFRVDSAGTAGYHSGEPPDSRSTEVAAAHGIRLTGFARQVTPRDLERFDIVVAMDRSNRRSLERLRRRLRSGRGTVADIVLMRDYDPGARDPDVPDPYYGGPGGFERVYRILERACNGLLDELAGVVAGILAGLATLYLTRVEFPRPLDIHEALWSLAVNFAVTIIVSRFTRPPSQETVERIHGEVERFVYER